MEILIGDIVKVNGKRGRVTGAPMARFSWKPSRYDVELMDGTRLVAITDVELVTPKFPGVTKMAKRCGAIAEAIFT